MVLINIIMRAMIFAVLLSACSASTDRAVYNRSPMINSAAAWVGAHEQYDRARLRDFLGVDPVAIEWCAAFVNSVLHELSLPGSESVHTHPLLARSFLSWGTEIHAAHTQPGDVVVFPRGTEGWQGHVGFYLNSVFIDQEEYWVILGGNQHNSVSTVLYPKDAAISTRRWHTE